MGRISLDSLCGGALLERFSLAMSQIGRNIVDPNTDPEKARSITIKITFKPDKSRRSLKTSIATNISMAPPVADETLMLVGQDLKTGRIEVSEYGNAGQAMAVVGEAVSVRAETIPPQAMADERGFDPDTGEIIEPQNYQKPIDLRKAN